MNKSYSKQLTANDIGITGGHQAGICIPRTNTDLVEFFPSLNKEQFNPDIWITCVDPAGEEWKMRYIYYNGKTFNPPKSSRNEYRLTWMTKFFRKWDVGKDDSVVFESTDDFLTFNIRIIKSDTSETIAQCSAKAHTSKPKVIQLRGWKRVY